jgi:hypothetical protein
MKNIRVQKVTANRIHAVRLTPVKMASRGNKWIAKNGIEDVGLMRPWGKRSVAMENLPGDSAGLSVRSTPPE